MSWVRDWAIDFMKWLFDPETILGVAADLIQWFLNLITTLLPEPLYTTFTGFKDWISSETVHDILMVFYFLASPLFDKTVLQASMAATMFIWIFAFLLKWFFWILSILWSSPT